MGRREDAAVHRTVISPSPSLHPADTWIPSGTHIVHPTPTEHFMSQASRTLTTDINVTPFLDILLVLLITFLAAMTARKTMDAQLPVPCAGACVSNDTPIMLEVLGDGSFLLNRKPVRATMLLATLKATYDGRPEKILQVAGHRDASYQGVLAAMDVAHSAGVKVIAIPPSESY